MIKRTVFGIVLCALTALAAPLYAGVLSELKYLPPGSDFVIYVDIKAIMDYSRRKGVPPSDIPYLMGEKHYLEAETLMGKFKLGITDAGEVLAAGRADDPKKNDTALMFITFPGKTGVVPDEMKKAVVKTPWGTLYEIDKKKKMCLSVSKGLYVIGMRPSVEAYLKNKQTAAAKTDRGLAAFLERSRGTCFYAQVSVSGYMRQKMDAAVEKGAKRGKGLDRNVFIKSILALQSVETGVRLGKQISFHAGMKGTGKEEGERLVMVSHFFIVGASLAVSFMDLLVKKKESVDDKNMAMVQDFFGRVKTRQFENGVTLSFYLTGEESEKFIAKAKQNIEGEKKKRALRLKQEAVERLVAAALKGDIGAVEKALSEKPDINVVDAKGMTALGAAAGIGSLDAVKLLMDRGADVNGRDEESKTPLFHAVEAGKKEVVAFLLEKGADNAVKGPGRKTPLHVNAVQGDVEITKLLASRAKEIDPRDENDDTPLHIAASRGSLEVVRVLTDHKADPELADGAGKRAIDRALENGHQEVVAFFTGKFNQVPAVNEEEEIRE